MIRFSPLFAFLALLTSPLGAAGADPEASLRAEDVWVRAMPPGQRMTAAYLRIVAGGEPVEIDGVSSPIGDASLHETQTVDGRSRMVEIEKLSLGPGETVELAPGGKHIMLMGLERTPEVGELVPICLISEGDSMCADAPVLRSPAGRSSADHGGNKP